MADVKIPDLAADAAITGVEKMVVSDGGNPKHIDVDQIVAYTQSELEAIATAGAIDATDSFVILQNDTDFMPVTYEVVENALAETMYAEADIGALADADVILVQDAGATKGTALMSAVATYTLAKNTATIRDISGTAANATPADAHLIMTIDGTTAKQTTWAEARASILGGMQAYTIALGAAAAGADANSFYVIQGGIEKEMTLLQLKTYVGVSVTGTGTIGKIPKWATASSLTDGYTSVDSFVAGSATALTSSLGVRTEMNDIIYDETAMANPLANADTILICDGDAATAQYKATLTQVKTWLEGEYAYIAGMDQAVDTTATPEFDGMTITDGGNIIADTGTGTEIATAAGQKLGFWGATPVAQPAHNADPAACAAITSAALTDNSGGVAADGTIDAIDATITDPADTPATADALRDDLVANAIPDIEGSFVNCADAIAELADQVNKLVADVTACKAAADANNASIDAINADFATTGLTASA